MKIFSHSFLWIIAASGVASLLFMLGNMFVLGLQRHPAEPRRYAPLGDKERGRLSIEHYGCGACHVIEGVMEASGRVGPQLSDISEQIYIAGILANTPENMARWISDPQVISPETLMPDLGVTVQEAHDIAAYLYEQPRTPLEHFLSSISAALARID